MYSDRYCFVWLRYLDGPPQFPVPARGRYSSTRLRMYRSVLTLIHVYSVATSCTRRNRGRNLHGCRTLELTHTRTTSRQENLPWRRPLHGHVALVPPGLLCHACCEMRLWNIGIQSNPCCNGELPENNNLKQTTEKKRQQKPQFPKIEI